MRRRKHHNETYRFGSAGFADARALKRAGLFDGHGLPVGFFEGRLLHLDGDAPILTVAGAGAGKLRDLLAYVVCRTKGVPMVLLDPRGELGAISWHTRAPLGETACFWNPMRIAGLPAHRINPLDILRRDSPNLHADAAFIVAGLVPLTGGNSAYFERRARDLVTAVVKALVERDGHTTLPAVYRAIGALLGDRDAAVALYETLLDSKFEDVRRIGGEMLAKQQDVPKEFSGIVGEVSTHLNFLDDPAVRDALDGADMSLADLCGDGPVCRVHLNVPAEYLSIWSPVIRVFFTVTMLYKARRPQARRVLLLVDEAGQLGKFEALLRAFTYGRGAGVRCWALFQDLGQIERNFDQAAVRGFLGSAQLRQFFGVRDYQTAKLISDMLGTQSLAFDAALQQGDARRRRRNMVREALLGGDPFAAGADYAHFRRSEQHRTRQARLLMTPDEIMNMPEDRQILFISGRDLLPAFASKFAYYTRREMAGAYLPNPYHPPSDRVRVQGRFRSRWACVRSGPVPDAYARFPQFDGGKALWVDGYPIT